MIKTVLTWSAGILLMVLMTFGFLQVPGVARDYTGVFAGWGVAVALAGVGAVLDARAIGSDAGGFVLWGICSRIVKMVLAIGTVFLYHIVTGRSVMSFALALGAGYLAFMVCEVVSLHRLGRGSFRPANNANGPPSP